jgi:hypothetical protein
MRAEAGQQLLTEAELACILTHLHTSNSARGHTAELREWLEARGLGPYAEALLAQDIELDIQPWRKPCFANS